LIVALSLFSKKFNRYLIPAFPAVDILAAAGVVGFGAWSVEFLGSRSKHQTLKSNIGHVLAGAVALIAVANGAWWHPYEIAAFNQALGGARAGAATFMVGWGEGLEQAAAWLNAQPDSTGVRVAAQRTEPLQAYLRRGSQAIAPGGEAFPQKTGYVVVYVRDVQSGAALPPFDRFYGRRAPAHIVIIHGVPYAWIYQLPPPAPAPRMADFDHGLHLRGFELAGTVLPEARLTLTLFWETRAALAADYTVFAHLVGPDGQRAAQADPLLTTHAWEANRFFTTAIPLELPAAAGSYQLVVGVYDSISGERLAVTAIDPGRRAADGPHAIALTEVVLPSWAATRGPTGDARNR
jgi:hypothetical protein